MPIIRFFISLFLYPRYRFRVAQVIEETPSVVSIFISGQDISHLRYGPGQYIAARFLSGRALRRERFYALSLPAGLDSLRIIVKDFSDYTKELRELKKGTKVLIAGPYGGFHQIRNEPALVVAGGTGIAPARVLVEALKSRGIDTQLIYFSSADGYYPLLDEIRNLAGNNLRISCLPGESAKRPAIDQELIKSVAPDSAGRAAYICGPPRLERECKKALRQLGCAHIISAS